MNIRQKNDGGWEMDVPPAGDGPGETQFALLHHNPDCVAVTIVGSQLVIKVISGGEAKTIWGTADEWNIDFGEECDADSSV